MEFDKYILLCIPISNGPAPIDGCSIEDCVKCKTQVYLSSATKKRVLGMGLALAPHCMNCGIHIVAENLDKVEDMGFNKEQQSEMTKALENPQEE